MTSKTKNSGYRRYLTLYFDNDHGHKPASHGAAKSLKGAKRSTVVRVWAEEQWKRAIIIDRDINKTELVLRRTPNGQVSVVRGDHAE